MIRRTTRPYMPRMMGPTRPSVPSNKPLPSFPKEALGLRKKKKKLSDSTMIRALNKRMDLYKQY